MKDPELKESVAPNGASKKATPAPAAYSGHPDDLHDLFAVTPDFTGPDDEDPLAALRNDPNYSALIRDLEYIAKQARLLFQPGGEAPSDDVWTKIRNQLDSETPES